MMRASLVSESVSARKPMKKTPSAIETPALADAPAAHGLPEAAKAGAD